MFKIGLDLGYGYTKGVNDNNKEILFPSIISMDMGFSPLDSSADIFKEHKEFNIRTVQENLKISISNGIDRREFLVGESARNESNSSNLLDNNKINSIETKVLLAASSVLLFPNDKVPVNLITGLPINQIRSQKQEFKDMFMKYKAVVSLPEYNIEKLIKFDKVDILPQGTGAVYASIWNDIKKYTIPNTYILFIDWGYKTIDYIVFAINSNGVPKLAGNFSGSLNNGMFQIGNDANMAFQSKTGQMLEVGFLNQLVSDGKTWFDGYWVDISKELKLIEEDRARKVKAALKSKLADIIDKIAVTFIGGGGGITMLPYLKDFSISTQLVNDAQMGNAKGYRLIADIRDKMQE